MKDNSGWVHFYLLHCCCWIQVKYLLDIWIVSLAFRRKVKAGDTDHGREADMGDWFGHGHYRSFHTWPLVPQHFSQCEVRSIFLTHETGRTCNCFQENTLLAGGSRGVSKCSGQRWCYAIIQSWVTRGYAASLSVLTHGMFPAAMLWEALAAWRGHI